MNRQVKAVLTFAPTLLIIAALVGAMTYDATSIPFYGVEGSGPIYFSSIFTADGGAWVGNCIYFVNFNLNSGGSWSSLGFYAQSGAQITVSSALVSTKVITMTVISTGANKTIEVYIPDFTPTNATNVTSWSYSATTGTLTMLTLDGTKTVVISASTTTTFRILDLVVAAFNFFGLSDISTPLFATISAFTTFFTSSSSAIILLITQIMTLVLFVSGSLIFWLTSFITFFINLFTIIGSIIDGTSSVQTGIGNMWTFFNFSAWVNFVPIVVFISWLDSLEKRRKQTGTDEIRLAIADLQLVSYVVGEVWNWTYTVFNFVFNVIMSLVGVLTGG